MSVSDIEIRGTYTIGITDTEIRKSQKNKEVYHKYGDKYWTMQKYDSSGNEISFKDSFESSYEKKYDSNNNMIYFKDSNGYIENFIYNDNNVLVYEKTSEDGVMLDKRPK